ncbi:probable pectinesterase 53, partial [Telopea speciosissima]|uniref:probable pectinesterase 53 n=1 Tax=Telopea speciosissima TaxID=54955 RepID=UPI001CC5DB80
FKPNTLSHQRNPTEEVGREAFITKYNPYPICRTAIHEVGKVCWKSQTLPVLHGKEQTLPSYTLIVHKNPAAGDFTTIQAAIKSLPFINLVRVVIKVNAGVYTEKVNIPPLKSFVTIEGAGADKTIVQSGETAQTIGSKGQPIGIFNSATFAINSPYFIAKNLTFKNTTPLPPPGASGKQAVALRISADTAAFWGCKFLGAQDTLYDHLGRHYYKDCYIEGSVDFTWADTITRAWGTFSRVVFAYTYMDDIILPKGWFNWGDPNREMTVFYGQYKCTGPGAINAGRVSWSRELTDEEAKPFISLSFIDGSEWINLLQRGGFSFLISLPCSLLLPCVK